jgi:toxin ParE2
VRLEFTTTAEWELDEAVAFYEARLAGLGAAFAWEAQKAGNLIVSHPFAWHKLDATTRRCRLNRFPYGLVYTVDNDTALVLAVMHLHRRPGYWRDRRS